MRKIAWAGGCQAAVGNALCNGSRDLETQVWKTSLEPALHRTGRAVLFADAELGNYGFIPFRVVLLQVVEQTTAPAYHHEKSAARAVVFLVRLEVVRQLANALA
jgi:hypothetical protein